MSLLLLLSAGTPAALTLTCEGASVLLVGNEVILVGPPRTLTAETRTYSVATQAAGLTKQFKILCNTAGIRVTAYSEASVFSDDFNRANNTTLGANWSLIQGAFAITSNKVYSNITDLQSFAAPINSFSSNHGAKITVSGDFNDYSDFAGVGVRVSSGTVADYRTWTELDPTSVISKVSNTVSITAMNATSGTGVHGVWYDGGTNWKTGDFWASVGPVTVTSGTENSRFIVAGLTNSNSTGADSASENRPSIQVRWVGTLTTPKLELVQYRSTDNLTSSPIVSDFYQGSAIAVNTPFYIEFERVGSVANCRIYSDASHLTLIDTLSINLTEVISIQYYYVAGKSSTGSSSTVTASIGATNFDTPATGYVLRGDGFSATNRTLFRYSYGNYVSIGAPAIPLADGDTIEVTAIGSNISAYVNNILKYSVTDTLYSSGKPAINYNWGNTRDVFIDDFYSWNIVDTLTLLKTNLLTAGGSVYRVKTEIDDAALFTDTITQANGTILGDTAEWDRWNTTTVDTINSNGTNAVSTTANRTSVGVIVANTAFGPDQWAEHTHASNSGGRFTSGPLVRASSGTTTNGYSFLNDGVAGETNPSAFRIVKHVSNGTPTTLATSGPQGFGPIANSTTYTMRLEVIGDRLFGYIDGKLIVTAIDSTFTTGQPGFQIIYGGSTISFSAGQIAASNSVVLAQRILTCTPQSYAVTSNDANLIVARNLTAKVFADEQLFSDDCTGTLDVQPTFITQKGDDVIEYDGNGKLKGNASSVLHLGYYNSVTFSNDHYSTCIHSTHAAGAGYSGVAVRIQPSATLGDEKAYIFTTSTTAGVYRIQKLNNGIATLWTSNILPVIGDVLTLSAVGITLNAYINGNLIKSLTDITFPTGVPGLFIYGATSRTDSISAGNYEGLHVNKISIDTTVGRVLSCSTASYTLALNDAILTKTAGRTLTADPVSFTLATTDTGLIYARRLALDVKTFTIATPTLNLLYGRLVTATKQTYTLSMTPANILRGRTVIADIRTYSLVRNDANILRGRSLPATSQTYSLVRNDADILRDRKLIADIRTYSLVRNDANIICDRSLLATSQTYSLVRNDANILRKAVLSATQQTYNLTGVAVALVSIGAKVLIANPAALTLGATEVTLARSRILSLTVYAGVLTRNPANILYGRKVIADIRTYTLSPSVTNLVKGRILGLTAYTAVLTRNPANILQNRTVIADIRTYTLSPSVTNLNRGRLLGVTVYAATLTRNPANILQNRTVIADIRAFTYTRVDANILKGSKLLAEKQSYNFTFNQLLFGRGGFIKVWTGSAWTPKPLKTWNGTAWVSKPLKVWTGSIWRTY